MKQSCRRSIGRCNNAASTCQPSTCCAWADAPMSHAAQSLLPCESLESSEAEACELPPRHHLWEPNSKSRPSPTPYEPYCPTPRNPKTNQNSPPSKCLEVGRVWDLLGTRSEQGDPKMKRLYGNCWVTEESVFPIPNTRPRSLSPQQLFNLRHTSAQTPMKP